MAMQTVAQIEDVAGLEAETVDHLARCFANALRRREQRARIEISLQRDAARADLARGSRICGPIEADRRASALHHRAKPRIAALSEEDRGRFPDRSENAPRVAQ